MTLALDVNPLLYASHAGSPFRETAAGALAELLDRQELVYLFWPVAVSYVRLSTNRRVFGEPLTLEAAFANLRDLLERPSVRAGSENGRFLDQLAAVCSQVRAVGDIISDAHIVALMRQHGVTRILTHDRDFRKFDGIRVIDPFG